MDLGGGLLWACGSHAGALSFGFALGGLLLVSVPVAVVDGEGVEDLGVAVPLLRLHNSVWAHLPQVYVAPGAPQRSCGELLHDVSSFYVVEPEQASVQKSVFFLGDAHRKTHRRDG